MEYYILFGKCNYFCQAAWAVLRSAMGTKAYGILTLLPPPGASTAFIANQ